MKVSNKTRVLLKRLARETGRRFTDLLAQAQREIDASVDRVLTTPSRTKRHTTH